MLRVPDGRGGYETADVEPTADGQLYHPTLGAWVSVPRRPRRPPGETHFERYALARGTPTADRVNQARVALVAARGCRSVLDVGIGAGDFIDHWTATPGHTAVGFDVNPVAEAWLLAAGQFLDPYLAPVQVDAVTLWDVLGHMADPERLLERVPVGGHLFLSVPAFRSAAVRASPYYAPDERLTHFRPWGPIAYLDLFGFDCLEVTDAEGRAGRPDVLSYAFRRTTPGR